MGFRQVGDRNLLRTRDVADDHELRTLLHGYDGSSSCSSSSTRCEFCWHGMRPLFWILLLHTVIMMHGASAQQSYDNGNYTCPTSKNTSCNSTILYRTDKMGENLTYVSTLFNRSAKLIATRSGLSISDRNSSSLPFATPFYIPINCSCQKGIYQATVSRLITKGTNTTTILNDYEGLPTVQAISAGSSKQSGEIEIQIPLRCACPSVTNIQQLLTFIIFPDETLDYVSSLFKKFVSPKNLRLANMVKSTTALRPYTTFLVPLSMLPNLASLNLTPSPAPAPSPPPSPPLSPLPGTPTPLPHSPPPGTPTPPPHSPPPGTPTPPPHSPPPGTPLPSPGLSPPGSKKKLYIGLGVGIDMALVVASLLGIFLVLVCRKKLDPRHGHGDPGMEPEICERLTTIRGVSTVVSLDSFNQDVSLAGMQPDVVGSRGKPMVFPYEELQEATMDFNDAKRIQGSVYLGKVCDMFVAIKQMKGNMTQPELKILTQVHHPNLVKLVGICQNNSGHLYLVYEYLKNGSLSGCLHNKDVNPRMNFPRNVPIFLPWTTRVHIALDVASGLDYIHNYTNPSFVHKDVTSSNILLDENFQAKIANFGMANLSANGSRAGLMLTKHIVGTQGYMAPEDLEHGLVTPKVDVFAFGVVLLEILSGKEAMVSQVEGGDNRAGEARPLSSLIDKVLEGDNYKEKLQAWMDPLLQNAYPLDTACSVANLAKKCLVADPALRHNMKDISYALSKTLESSLEWESSVLSGTRDTTDVSIMPR